MFKARLWERQLKAHVERLGYSTPQTVHDLLTLLRLWDQAMCVMVSASVAANADPVIKPFQMRYDDLWVYFRRLNEFAKKVLQSQHARQSMVKSAFRLDPIVVTPLFFCGFYCREWSIRREALHLLRAFEQRCKGSHAAAFVPMKLAALERIIDIESYGLQLGDMVPESSRIHFVHITGRPGSSNMCFSYRQLGTNGVVDMLID